MSSFSQKTRDDLRQVYRSIATEFSNSRSQPWKEFEIFASFIQDESSVLDLGCGNGRFYHYLTAHEQLQIEYTGIDFTPEFLQIAKDRYPKAHFEEQDISNIDLRETFDVVACIAAFHHLPSRKLRLRCLKKIAEHMHEDGILLLSVWNLWQWRFVGAHVKAFFRWAFSGFRGDRRGLMIPFGKEKLKRYYHAFFVFEVKQLLNSSGFRVEHFETSRHNYLFVCHLHNAAVTPEPVRKLHKMSPLKSPAVAASRSHSS